MSNDNYYVIQGWMINELNLSGPALSCYAIIYGITQDGESDYHGSRKYLAEALNVSSLRTVDKALKDLLDAGLIVKECVVNNNVTFCRYRALRGSKDSLGGGAKSAPPVQNLHGGGAKSARGGGAKIAHNNKYIDNKENIYNNKYMFNSDELNDCDDLFSLTAAEDFSDHTTPTFETFWRLYAKKRGKIKAQQKWDRLTRAEKIAIIEYLPKYIESTPDVLYRKDPATFLNNKSWCDDIIVRTNVAPKTASDTQDRQRQPDSEDPWQQQAERCKQWMQLNGISFHIDGRLLHQAIEAVDGCGEALKAILLLYRNGKQSNIDIVSTVRQHIYEEPYATMIQEYKQQNNNEQKK